MTLGKTLLKHLLNVKDAVIEGYELVDDEQGVKSLYIDLHPTKAHADRCPVCGKRCAGYDQPNKTPTVWRHLDFTGIRVFLRHRTRRVQCPEHGVVTASVPWAFDQSCFTTAFDMTVGWLSKELSKSAIATYMRIDWKTVGRCINRVLKVLEPDSSSRLDNLVRIGIDETSRTKGHNYITVVVNHDTNTVVWAKEGHSAEVLNSFFDELTDAQKQSIKYVTCDGAQWIKTVVEKRIPHAVRCLDRFHVAQWATDFIDKLRCKLWREQSILSASLTKEAKMNEALTKDERDAKLELARAVKKAADDVKGAMYVFGKSQENLTEKQLIKQQMLFARHPTLEKAYRYKEQLKEVFNFATSKLAEAALKAWYYSASHCHIPEIKELAKKVWRHRAAIINTVEHKLSNARIEANNTKIKLIIRKAYGFRNIESLISMVKLICSNLSIPLPNTPEWFKVFKCGH
ncbi:MAG: ISL3 family transposase [Sutterellaceae bacterium]|nr:ISL3 family transposase [Sutterellaceae bacterium]